jgi:hypothetical protein
MMEDEIILNEQQFLQLGEERQLLLLAQHCIGIENAIRGAISRDGAERIADDACRRFNIDCSSTIVRGALRRYIQNMINEHWSGI